MNNQTEIKIHSQLKDIAYVDLLKCRPTQINQQKQIHSHLKNTSLADFLKHKRALINKY